MQNGTLTRNPYQPSGKNDLVVPEDRKCGWAPTSGLITSARCHDDVHPATDCRDAISAITELKNGRLIIGTNGAGLYEWNGGA
jgi:hypothetical protein